MKTWFIRLGSNSYKADKDLYQALARDYSIVKIGYGIDRDITKKDREYIKEYLVERNKRLGWTVSNHQIGAIASLINQFVNEIQVGDIIISPFENGYIRVGVVKSKCHPVEAFFQDRKKELDRFLMKHPGAKEQQNQRIKPAIQVKWLDEEKRQSDLPQKIQSALAKPMRKTISDLQIEVGEEETDGEIKTTEEEMEKEVVSISSTSGSTQDDDEISNELLLEMLEDQNKKNEDWSRKTFITAIITALIAAIFSAMLSVSLSGVVEAKWFDFIKPQGWAFISFAIILIGAVIAIIAIRTSVQQWRSFWRKVANSFRGFMEWCYCGGCGCCRRCSKRD